VWLTVVTALAALAGCGGSSSDGATPDGDAQTGSGDSSETTAGDEGDEEGDDGEERTTTTIDPATLPPIDRLWVNQDTEVFAEREREIEAAKAACMRGLGWQYTPMDTGQFFTTGPDVDPDEFREQWGYGITTFIGREDENPWNGGVDEEFVDPNNDYVMSLPEAEQNAFYEDLYGKWDDAPIDDGDIGPTEPLVAGCDQTAREEVVGEDPWSDPAMNERLNEMYEASYSDPRIEELYVDWAACMASDGFDQFSKPDEVYEYFSNKANELQGSEGGVFFETTVVEGESGEAFPADGDGDGGPTTTASPEEIKAVQDEEVAVANADWACQEEHVREQLLVIQTEIQEQFIAENPDIWQALQRQAGVEA
jgi:hypothetical protein